MSRWILAVLAVMMPFPTTAQDDDQAFELQVEDGYFLATGILFPNSGKHVAKVTREHPDIRVLVMLNVPGSDDDNDYMETAWKLRQAGFTTMVPRDGLVASGGTDFFLAGSYRIIEPGACIGVHSWEEGGPPSYQATQIPRDHEDHEDFLSYFQALGISPDFYWFTIDAAPANGMHWMSPEEINHFGLSSLPLPASAETVAERAARCEARFRD